MLIDWSQNNGKKTTIAPYSLRGRFRPTVAAPRTWEELDDPGLRHLEAHEVLERVASGDDPLAVITAASHDGPLAEYLSMRKTGRHARADALVELGSARRAATRRFVIQEHHARRLHFDLRLERDGVLKSWAVPKGVPETSGVNHLAVQTEDHPMEYATFEGTIPAGEYGAGSMTIWDAGTYETEKWRDEEVIIDLDGQPGGPLGGRVRLALIRTDGSGEKSSWLLHRMKDQRPGHWSPSSKARHASEVAADAAGGAARVTDAADADAPTPTPTRHRHRTHADDDAADAAARTAQPRHPTRRTTTTTDPTRSSRSSCDRCSRPRARSAWSRGASGRSSGSGTASACSPAPTAAASAC